MEAMRRRAMDKPTERPMVRVVLVFSGKPVELKGQSRTQWVSLMVPVDAEKPK